MLFVDLTLFILLIICLVIQGAFMPIPLGNENSTVRRIPYVTFGIMLLNALIYFLSLPITVDQEKAQVQAFTELYRVIEQNSEILADQSIRDKLKDVGLFRNEIKIIEQQLKNSPELEQEYKAWLRGAEATKIKDEIERRIIDFKAAAESSFYGQWGLTGNGKWKPYQLLTYAFLHGNSTLFGFVFPLHLFGNLIALFAVGLILEDLWGRSTFLLFYLCGAVVAAVPDALMGNGLIGASGAVSAAMGAFLVRLPKTKLKVGWLALLAVPVAIGFFLAGRKPWGIVRLPGYVYIGYFFLTELLLVWYYTYRLGLSDGVSHSCHIAGLVFGIAFAAFIKASRVEEKHINPKIEAKVSFSASPVVTNAIEMLDRGEAVLAERKLKAHVAKNPDDADALLALIQVYQHTNNFDGLNAAYGYLIRHHLTRQDKEAALYAYDNLLSSFPDNEVKPRIPVRDWLTVCEYLLEAGMKREAAVEYERLVDAYPDDPLGVRACVQGGEAALSAHDNHRALRLLERAQTMRPTAPLMVRIEAGLEKVRVRLDNRPDWLKKPQRTNPLAKDLDEQNVNW